MVNCNEALYQDVFNSIPRFSSSKKIYNGLPLCGFNVCHPMVKMLSATHFDLVVTLLMVNNSPHNGKPLSICSLPQYLEVNASKHELMASASLCGLLFTMLHQPIRK